MSNIILRNIGIFILADGLLSIYLMPTTQIETIVRVIRAGIGLYLVYKFK